MSEEGKEKGRRKESRARGGRGGRGTEEEGLRRRKADT